MKRNCSMGFNVICVILLLSELAFAATSFLPVHGETTNTFGYTGEWDSNAATFGGIYVSNFTSPPNLKNITQIGAFIATGGTLVAAVIYSDNNGKPDTLLAQSGSVSVSGTSGKWITFGIVFSGNPNTKYWLGILFLGSGTYFYATGKVDSAIYETAGLSSEPPRIFSNATVYSGNEMRIYAAFSSQTQEQPLSNLLQDSVVGFLQWVVIIGLIIASILIAAVLTSKNKRKRCADMANHGSSVA